MKKIVICISSIVLVIFFYVFFFVQNAPLSFFEFRLHFILKDVLGKDTPRTVVEIESDIKPLLSILEFGDIELNIDQLIKKLDEYDTPAVIRTSLDLLSLKEFGKHVHPSEVLINFIGDYCIRHPEHERKVSEDNAQQNTDILKLLIKTKE